MGRPIRTRPIVNEADPELIEFLRATGLATLSEEGNWLPLSGGVSSDIWHVRLGRGEYCVKRALAELKTTAVWRAPIGRNATEWDYMQVVHEMLPGAVPKPIARDNAVGAFAMEWLAPDTHALWKTELLAGMVDGAFASSIGALMGSIHAGTANDDQLRRRFATDSAFNTLRIEPYFEATAQKHPELACVLRSIAKRTTSTKQVLVHGDVSPKNILKGPAGPVLLDAEVAWFGDPAFDLAFCINHLVIKSRVVTGASNILSAAIAALAGAYFARVTWEDVEAIEERTAALLPALALARVDGMSPVEYLTHDQQQGLRSAAAQVLVKPSLSVAETVSRLQA